MTDRANRPGVVARLRAPEAAIKGEVVKVRTMLSHPMENGLRRDRAGNIVPRNLATDVAAYFNSELVFRAKCHTAISANPYVAFTLVVEDDGELEVRWLDDRGGSWSVRQRIVVA